ncbi:DUF4175 domain-containing protein [Actinoplanes aureus]|jgi:hypothetical protein|nr:DUF4175 domain-containing protein [Actinoplanes aureus]
MVALKLWHLFVCLGVVGAFLAAAWFGVRRM